MRWVHVFCHIASDLDFGDSSAVVPCPLQYSLQYFPSPAVNGVWIAVPGLYAQATRDPWIRSC